MKDSIKKDLMLDLAKAQQKEARCHERVCNLRTQLAYAEQALRMAKVARAKILQDMYPLR